jgi:major membrane immunogen (membrane-anchored lipoprotein)
MKKSLLILAAIVFAVTACDKNTYVDGTYKASYETVESESWTDYVSFTLTGDEITNVDYDAVDAAGNLKSADSAYNARMASMRDTKPEIFMPQIEAAIANTTIAPEYEAFDAISGATGSSEDANLLMEAALDLAIDGDPTEVVIARPVEEE